MDLIIAEEKIPHCYLGKKRETNELTFYNMKILLVPLTKVSENFSLAFYLRMLFQKSVYSYEVKKYM